jgi:hypothetical protein
VGGETLQLNQTTGWVMSYSPEYNLDAAGDGAALLSDLALLTGGRSLADDPAGAFAHNLGARPATTPIWPWLLLAALLLLPVDVAVRRLIVTRRELARAWEAISGRATAVAEGPSERLTSLMGAKERGRRRAEGVAADAGVIGALRSRRDQVRAEREAAYSAEAPAATGDGPRYTPRQEEAAPSGNIAGQLLKKRKEREKGGG